MNIQNVLLFSSVEYTKRVGGRVGAQWDLSSGSTQVTQTMHFIQFLTMGETGLEAGDILTVYST